MAGKGRPSPQPPVDLSRLTSAPPAEVVSLIHTLADTDTRPEAIHHTLGQGQNQAARGNHTHDGTTGGGAVLGYIGFGTTAQRDTRFGVPSTAQDMATLANSKAIWYNTDTGMLENYYAVTGTAGLTVPGLFSGWFTAGWYADSPRQWAGKSGPDLFVANYKSRWARGVNGAASAIDAVTDVNGIRIGLTGIYEMRTVFRGGPSGTANYAASSINGDRAAFENRSLNIPIIGVWTHSHPAATNNFTESVYMGQLLAGDLLCAGPQITGTDIQLSANATAGLMTVRRIT